MVATDPREEAGRAARERICAGGQCSLHQRRLTSVGSSAESGAETRLAMLLADLCFFKRGLEPDRRRNLPVETPDTTKVLVFQRRACEKQSLAPKNASCLFSPQ